MKYGYARVSTKGQAKDGNSLYKNSNPTIPKHGLSALWNIFSAFPHENHKLLNDIQDGDMLIVTKLDRIARSTMQGIGLIEALVDKGVIIHVLNIGMMDFLLAPNLILF